MRIREMQRQKERIERENVGRCESLGVGVVVGVCGWVLLVCI